jgi:hypothetical protein
MKCPNCNKKIDFLDNIQEDYVYLVKEVHRLKMQGVFNLQRNPFELMPAIEAYAAADISSGRLRECIADWLSGVDFNDKKNRNWEQ